MSGSELKSLVVSYILYKENPPFTHFFPRFQGRVNHTGIIYHSAHMLITSVVTLPIMYKMSPNNVVYTLYP